jgi:hypothetical protein
LRRNLDSRYSPTLAFGWQYDDEWVVEKFYDSFDGSGARRPSIKDIERLYVPGLMTANKELRDHWGEPLCVTVVREFRVLIRIHVGTHVQWFATLGIPTAGSDYTRYAWHGTSDIAAERIAVEVSL